MSNSKKVLIMIITSLLLYIISNNYDEVLYYKYLSNSNRTVATVTSGSISGNSRSISLIYKFRYSVNKTIYEGRYSIPKESNMKGLKYPNGKYLLLYSKEKPEYHIILPIEVTKTNYKTVKINSSEDQLKKKFNWNNNRAKVIKHE